RPAPPHPPALLLPTAAPLGLSPGQAARPRHRDLPLRGAAADRHVPGHRRVEHIRNRRLGPNQGAGARPAGRLRLRRRVRAAHAADRLVDRPPRDRHRRHRDPVPGHHRDLAGVRVRRYPLRRSAAAPAVLVLRPVRPDRPAPAVRRRAALQGELHLRLGGALRRPGGPPPTRRGHPDLGAARDRRQHARPQGRRPALRRRTAPAGRADHRRPVPAVPEGWRRMSIPVPGNTAPSNTAPTNTALVELRNTTRWYGNVVAVNDITMTLGPGVTGLLGP